MTHFEDRVFLAGGIQTTDSASVTTSPETLTIKLHNFAKHVYSTMKFVLATSLLLFSTTASAFSTVSRLSSTQSSTTSLPMIHRRAFGQALLFTAASTVGTNVVNAEVFFDPAQYGDQELRVSAVDSVKESVRRAILQNPPLAPAFYQLALLDALSFNANTRQFGPDGSVLKTVLAVDPKDDDYLRNLQGAAYAILEAEQKFRKKTAISVADAIAIGGAEAIESIGGPSLTVQLGRADTPKEGPIPKSPPIDLLSGRRSNREIIACFQQSGLTDREMTALLGGLMTLELVEKGRSVADWKASARPKFREPGKMGRMSEFRPITEEDIAQAELEADPDYRDPDDGWYIADSFGSKENRFGERLAKEDINEKTFNKYMKELSEAYRKKNDVSQYGWVATLLLDPDLPNAQTWLNKYGGSNLNYLKDLNIAFFELTQLGAVYTGGKYESLLKNKPRKSLNDDGLDLF